MQSNTAAAPEVTRQIAQPMGSGTGLFAVHFYELHALGDWRLKYVRVAMENYVTANKLPLMMGTFLHQGDEVKNVYNS